MALQHHESEVVGFPYQHFPAPRLSIDTQSIVTRESSTPSPTRQHWVDVRPLSPTTPSQPTSPSWHDVRPLALMSSSASILSFQSRSSLTKAKLSELRSRLRGTLPSMGSRPASMYGDAGSLTIDESPSASSPRWRPGHSRHTSMPQPPTTSSYMFGRPSLGGSAEAAELKRQSTTKELAPGWARVIAEKNDLDFVGRETLDVVDTEDHLGDMIDSLNGRISAGRRGRTRARHPGF